MMKIKAVGDSYALLVGHPDPGEDGFLSLRVADGRTVRTLLLNGRGFSASGDRFRLPVTAFRTGSNRLALALENGTVIPCEGIRLTGGLFSPEGATVPDVIAACDARFARLAASLEQLAARVKALEDDSGILP